MPLVNEDPDHRLGSEITHTFVANVAALELYASSTRSALAGNLGTVVKDMLVEDEVLAKRSNHDGTGGVAYSRVSGECTRNQSACTPDIRFRTTQLQKFLIPLSTSHSSSSVLDLNDYLLDESEEGDVPLHC